MSFHLRGVPQWTLYTNGMHLIYHIMKNEIMKNTFPPSPQAAKTSAVF